MHNYWSTYKNKVASWEVHLPELNRHQSIDFVRQVLDAGRRERVYEIVETPEPDRFVARDGYSYVEYLRDYCGSDDELPLFPEMSGPLASSRGRLLTLSTLAYFSASGEIVEEPVNDVGELKNRLSPPEYLVRIRTQPLSMIYHYTDPRRIVIYLDTDIWFPWVVGYEEMGEGDWVAPTRIGEMYDNRALAARHTVRLNRFLASVKELVESIGGTWEPDDPWDIYGWYLAMYKPWGIDLDVDPTLPFPQLNPE